MHKTITTTKKRLFVYRHVKKKGIYDVIISRNGTLTQNFKKKVQDGKKRGKKRRKTIINLLVGSSIKTDINNNINSCLGKGSMKQQ